VTGLRGYRGRHRARQAGVAGGALIIIAGAVAFGLAETGGAGAAALPTSCTSSGSSTSATDAAAANAARAAALSPSARRARPAAAGAGTVTPLAGDAQGIDISDVNFPSTGTATEPDWSTLKSSGVSFVAIKASEGDYYTDEPPYTDKSVFSGYQAATAAATAAGLSVMPYAFGNPHAGNGTPQCQADYAWQEINSVTSPAYSSGLMLPLVLDIEQDPYANSDPTLGPIVNSCYNQTTSGMATWIGQFLTEAQADTGRTPIIYTNSDFWSTCTGNATSFTLPGASTATSFSSYPLWIADPGVTSPSFPATWSSSTLWQFNWTGTVPGVSGSVDQDYLTPLLPALTTGTAITPVQLRTLGTLDGQSVTYSAASGLPSGLAVSSAGVISGTPTTAGTYQVVINTVVTNTGGAATPTLSFPWSVAGNLTVTAPAAESTVAGVPVLLQVGSTDTNAGLPGYTAPAFTMSGQPAGTSISSTGLITGWPYVPGTYKITVTAKDGLGAAAMVHITWTVRAISTGVTGAIRQSGGSGKCLDDPSSRTANWTPIDLVTCNGKANQAWTAVPDGTVRVLGDCLTASGTGVFLYACNNSIAEVWRAGSFGSLVSARYGTCLNGPSGAVADGTKANLAACQNTASQVNQHWTRPVTPIVSGVAAKCLNVAAGTGTAVTIYTCGNYATEHWTLEPSGTLVAQSSGKCLTKPVTAPTTLIQYPCVKGALNQQWTLATASAIATELKNPQTGLCVTVPAGSSANNTALVLGACSSALNSAWRVG
jgi:GH25 family lysozyme M1 (1,4-beta-N-acetylmuramidase)